MNSYYFKHTFKNKKTNTNYSQSRNFSLKSKEEIQIESVQCKEIIAKITEEIYENKEKIDDFLNNEGKDIREPIKTELVYYLIKSRLKSPTSIQYINNFLQPFGFYKQKIELLLQKEKNEIVQKSKVTSLQEYNHYFLDDKSEIILIQGSFHHFSLHELKILYPNIDNLFFEAFTFDLQQLLSDDYFSDEFYSILSQKVESKILDKFQRYKEYHFFFDHDDLQILYFIMKYPNYSHKMTFTNVGGTIFCSNQDAVLTILPSKLIIVPLIYQIQQRDFSLIFSQFVSDHFLLKNLSKIQKKPIIDSIQIVNMDYNQTIIHEQTNNDFLYIIFSGMVKILKNHIESKIQLQEQSPSTIFGEEVFKKQKSEFNCVCIQSGTLIAINKKIFSLNSIYQPILIILNEHLQAKIKAYQTLISYQKNKEVQEEKSKADVYKLKYKQHQLLNYVQKPTNVNKKRKNLSHYDLLINKGSDFNYEKINKLNLEIWKQKIEKFVGETVEDPLQFTKTQKYLDFKRSRTAKVEQKIEENILLKPKQQFLKKKKNTYLLHNPVRQENASMMSQSKNNSQLQNGNQSINKTHMKSNYISFQNQIILQQKESKSKQKNHAVIYFDHLASFIQSKHRSIIQIDKNQKNIKQYSSYLQNLRRNQHQSFNN